MLARTVLHSRNEGIIAKVEKDSEQNVLSRCGIVFAALCKAETVIFSAAELHSVNISLSAHSP